MLCFAAAAGAYRGQKRYGLSGWPEVLMRRIRSAAFILGLGTFIAGVVLALIL